MEKIITPGSVLAWGIVALALCFSPIVGLIFAIIGFVKAKSYVRANGPAYGQAKVGSVFSKIALPVSIVMQVIWLIYFIAFGAMLAYM